MRKPEAVISRESHSMKSQQHKHAATATRCGDPGPAPTRGDLGRLMDALTTLLGA